MKKQPKSAKNKHNKIAPNLSKRIKFFVGITAFAVVGVIFIHFSHAAPQYPAQVIDLANWKLTLPIQVNGSTYAGEIKQPTLATYAITPWFTVNANGDGVVFRANAGGVTTSGLGYPRSELREMTNNGTQNADWAVTSSSISSLTVTGSTTKLTPVKPQAVIGQIHDASSDIIEILADGTRVSTPGTISICYRYNGTTQSPCLDTAYTLGTRYTYQIVAGNGRIQIYYNGVKKVDIANTSSGGDYFKAGCYTQSNTSKGDTADAYAEAVIYKVQVTHGTTPPSPLPPSSSTLPGTPAPTPTPTPTPAPVTPPNPASAPGSTSPNPSSTSSMPSSQNSNSTVSGTVRFTATPNDPAVVKVDGRKVSNNGTVDTTKLTNGTHKVSVVQGAETTTSTIDVHNNLGTWQTIRNQMLVVVTSAVFRVILISLVLVATIMITRLALLRFNVLHR